jgi:hypothetical protein
MEIKGFQWQRNSADDVYTKDLPVFYIAVAIEMQAT